MAESPLDRLLRLAADVSLLEPSVLGVADKSDHEPDEDEAHEHLMHECSWYKAVSNGEGVADPDKHCGPAHTEGALIKFTPRTPEASTVDQPTVPPGGPGLFHVKGLHLPPYIQHLYPHLVARYGKQGAYRVAVGVVKKWAAGVNPGGYKTKSGKGKRTHPDVKAAAGKNIAQWEADKAKAHAQSAKSAVEHVKASAMMLVRSPGAGETPVLQAGATPLKPPPVPCDPFAAGRQRENLALAALQPSPMEGGKTKILPLPVPPKQTAAMMTAHRVSDMRASLAHAVERMAVARKSKDPEIRKYESLHIRNHLARTIGTGHMLADNLRRNYPAEGRELDATVKTLGLASGLSSVMKAATTAHLLMTILADCAHASRHAQFLGKTDPRDQWEFNAEHAEKHLRGALEHACKLHEHITDNYPAEAKWLASLDDPDTLVKAAAVVISAPGAGKPQQLRQESSQTVSPSQPPPPKADLPTPKELRAFAAEIKKMTDDDDHHLMGAQLHLESAAEKMVTNPVNALMSLRSAQTAIQQAWRFRVQRAQPRIAYVFSENTPSVEQSRQQQVRAQEQARIGEMQGAASKITVFIARVRKAYFSHMSLENETAGGGLSGYPNARL
jgi:hypothetical protein